MSLINSKRLRDYPRLFFIATWTILTLNVIFRQGWNGLFRQIIGSDFITLYSAGLLQRIDPANLYNFVKQAAVQQSVIQPTTLPGVNPFISPPYVASIYSLFTLLPLPMATIIWSILSLIITLLAIRLIFPLLPEKVRDKLSYWQLSIIVLSFFPFIEGFQVGQYHSLNFLLITCIVLFSLSDHWFMAGVMAGLMIFKLHLVIGFLLIWLIWRKFKALTGFAVITVLWVGVYLLIYGFSPIQNYLKISQELVLLPYVPGFPGYLQITPYGFLSTILPIQALSITFIITTLLSIILAIVLCWFAYRLRNKSIPDRIPVLVLAILFPLVASPYALLHDLIIIIPGFIIWTCYSTSRNFLYATVAVYLAGLLLTFLSSMTKIALTSVVPIGLFIFVILWVYMHRNFKVRLEKQ